MKQNQAESLKFCEFEQNFKEQITNISHDLRTPLASILGYFELINHEEIDEGSKAHYLGVVQKRAHLLQTLLNHYYELTKIDSDALTLQMSLVDVGELLAEVLVTFYDDFSSKQMKVEVIQKLETLKIVADNGQLQHVFINLIQNVLQHGCEQCRVVHEIQRNQTVTMVMNKVLNPEQIEIMKVFNRLYTTDKTRNSQNTGLGLTITQLLIEKMGHQINAALSESGWFVITIIWQV